MYCFDDVYNTFVVFRDAQTSLYDAVHDASKSQNADVKIYGHVTNIDIEGRHCVELEKGLTDIFYSPLNLKVISSITSYMLTR